MKAYAHVDCNYAVFCGNNSNCSGTATVSQMQSDDCRQIDVDISDDELMKVAGELAEWVEGQARPHRLVAWQANGKSRARPCASHEPCDSRDGNLYVKGLAPSVLEVELREIFSKAGKVPQIKIMRSPECTDSLIRMASMKEAKTAIELLDTVELQAALSVCHHAEKVQVSGLAQGCRKEELEELFRTYGAVLRCRRLPEDAAVVQMQTAEQAARAVKALNAGVHSLKISFAGKAAKAFQNSALQVRLDKKDPRGKNLYVMGLPRNTTESQLRACFAHGKVVRMRLLPQQGRTEAHALVEMMSSEDAARAIEKLNGTVL